MASGATMALFLLLLLIVVACLIALVYRTLRGRSARGLGIVMAVAIGVYAVMLVAASAASHTRQIALGMDKCFDDWCATVTGARVLSIPSTAAGSKVIVVMLRVSNRALRAAFRPSQPRVHLVLESGEVVIPADPREIEAKLGPQQNLSTRLAPGESYETAVGFHVPAGVRKAAIVILEGPVTVTQFLVDDETSFGHKKTVFPIEFE